MSQEGIWRSSLQSQRGGKAAVLLALGTVSALSWRCVQVSPWCCSHTALTVNVILTLVWTHIWCFHTKKQALIPERVPHLQVFLLAYWVHHFNLQAFTILSGIFFIWTNIFWPRHQWQMMTDRKTYNRSKQVLWHLQGNLKWKYSDH